jgi:hypothetical protein
VCPSSPVSGVTYVVPIFVLVNVEVLAMSISYDPVPGAASDAVIAGEEAGTNVSKPEALGRQVSSRKKRPNVCVSGPQCVN